MNLKKFSRKIALILFFIITVGSIGGEIAFAKEKDNNMIEFKSKIQEISQNETENVLKKTQNWILQQRDDNGFWGSGELKLYFTSEVVSSKYFENSKPEDNTGIVDEKALNNSDYLSRYLMLEENDKYFKELIKHINNDGGCGNIQSQDSNVWDTFLLAKYLKKEKIKNKEMLNAVVYLLTKQNNDGGWSFVSGEASDLHLTASIVCLLNEFEKETNLATDKFKGQLRKAAEYIEGKRDEETFWGIDDDNLNMSFLAMRALIGNIEIDYMSKFKETMFAKQKENGSWANDVITSKNAIETLDIVIEETTDEIHELILG